MEQLKKLKPIHLYLIAVLIMNVGTYFSEYSFIHILFLITGLASFIFAVVKQYREE
jgi:hypothetical protein